MSKISVIIPTMEGREEMLNRLLLSIPQEIEKIVVSGTGLLAKKRNEGARIAKGDFFVFIDDDNYLKENALNELLLFSDFGLGVKGIVACYDDKKELIADGGSKRNYLTGFMKGINTNRNVGEISYKFTYEVDEVANAFMIPRNVFEEVGGFDEKNFPIDLDEADICKRIKNLGYKITMCPTAICYHKSQTYSVIPDFRRPMNAYFMGRNRILYQKKHLSRIKYAIYFIFFLPVFVVSYCLSLIYRMKPWMCFHFLKGVFDGIFGCFKNKYQ